MRLIDADKLIEELKIKTVSKDAHIISIANAVVNLVHNQPTAFNVEKVVAELKALEEMKKIKELGECYIIPKNGVWEVNGIDIHKALEKQIPKKLQQTKDGNLACECGLVIQVKNKRNCLYHCHNCGQRIDWCK